MNFVSYMAGISGFLYFLFDFLTKHRCFVKEGGQRYGNNIGVNFDSGFVERINCYLYWSFTSWLVVFILIAVGLVFYLRNLDAPPPKVIVFYLGMTVIFMLIQSFVIAGEGHQKLVGGV